MFIEPCSQLFTSINIFVPQRAGWKNKFGGLAERKEQQSGSFIGRRRTPSLLLSQAKKQNMIIEAAAFEAVRMNMFSLTRLCVACNLIMMNCRDDDVCIQNYCHPLSNAAHSTITYRTPVSSKRVYFEKAHGFLSSARISLRNSKSFLSFNTLNDTLSLNYISNSQDWRALEIKADAPLSVKLARAHQAVLHNSWANWRN